MFSPPSLLASDYYGPAIAASCFVLFMSRVAEPGRRTFNAILVAGSCGAYLNRGFGPWELAYPLLATPVVYAGPRSYTFIGIAWLMHAARDLAHHLWGNPIWPFMRTSSWGCLVFDVIIAIWFLASAPALVGHGTKTPADGVTLSGRLAAVGTEWKSSCRSHINGRAPKMRISTSLRALCCQSGLVETFDTPIRARRRSIGSRSLRMSPLLTARFTRAPIASQT
jgi:Family of unknown function (DUF6010)